MQEIRIREEVAGQRFDKFLRRYFPEAGSGFLYKMLRKKNIRLNGKKASGSELLADGDIITVYFSDETIAHFRGETSKETRRENRLVLPASWILFEDEHLLAIAKPAGILSQRSGSEESSLVESIKSYLPESGHGLFDAGVSNRLDRNTSGIVLAGKDNASSRQLSEMIRKRSLRKYYLALCAGTITEPMTLKGFLKKDSRTNTVRIRTEASGNGADRIETVVRPLQTGSMPAPENAKGNASTRSGETPVRKGGTPVTLIEVELVTGKTHQIRAHLSSIGHPLVGDPRYGDPRVNQIAKRRFGLTRQFLHASRIEFPKTDGILREESGRVLVCSLPEELQTVLAGAGIKE